MPHRVMRPHRWSDFLPLHTVLHCGYGGCVDLMWCSSEEFHVPNSWEMDVRGHTLGLVCVIKWLAAAPCFTQLELDFVFLLFQHARKLSAKQTKMTSYHWGYLEIMCQVSGVWTHMVNTPQWQRQSDRYSLTLISSLVSIAKLHLLSCFYILCWIQKPKTWDEEKC